MLLHVHEWGDENAPPLICLHGVTAHGRRFHRLAEEHWSARFRVLAPDLRGHGRSGIEPPWTIATHIGDIRETLAALGVARAVWVGHSFGGRLVLELAARSPESVERAILLDPAIQVLPHVGLDFAEDARRDEVFDSIDEAVHARLAAVPSNPRPFVEEDMREHLVRGPDGRLRPRSCRSAVVTIYSELCTDPPSPGTLAVPTLLVYAPGFGLVREAQLAAYATALGDLLQVVAVPGGHVVYWDALEQTVAAIDPFLADALASRAGRG